MQLRIWMLDIAREQAPSYEDLRRYLEVTREGGYNAIGLYFEHRFAYPSTPWAHGKGCVTPDMVQQLERDFPDIQIVPFVNLLGHYEGMLYTEHGKRFREERFKGLQACPSCPEFVDLAGEIIDDVIRIFKSPLIHIGGDETNQLGKCPRCTARVAAAPEGVDGKAILYGEHFGPLAERVTRQGRQPAVWADMFRQHPQALDLIPKDCLMFDWEYFKNPLEGARPLVEKGYEVVLSPAIHTYNAAWCHLPQSEQNVRDSVAAAQELGAYGVCVTTWECGLMGNYETILPAIRASGKLISSPETAPPAASPVTTEEPLPEGGFSPSWAGGAVGASVAAYRDLHDAPAFLAEYAAESEEYAAWARLMGCALQDAGGSFVYGTIRSSLKCRLLLYSNPFLAWMHHADEYNGIVGDRILAIADQALFQAPNASARGVAQFVKKGVEFVRFADQARQAYAQGLPGVAIASLSPCRQVFEDLEKVAIATNVNAGGSLADIERCRRAKAHVELVIRRVKEFGDGSLGYLPAWEILTHPMFMPHDQASWWLINGWARE